MNHFSNIILVAERANLAETIQRSRKMIRQQMIGMCENVRKHKPNRM